MNEQKFRHVIVGKGPLGLALAEACAATGESTVVISRHQPLEEIAGVAFVRGDVRNLATIEPFLDASSVLYHCANVPYPRWFLDLPGMTESFIALARATGARLVVGDNLYAYDHTAGPMAYGAAERPVTRKGALRKEIADRYRIAHASGEAWVAIGRASDFFGPRVEDAMLGGRVFRSLLAGKAAGVVGDPDQLHTYTFIRDAARGLLTLGQNDSAGGAAWVLPSGPTLTTREFLAVGAELTERSLKLQSLPQWAVTAIGWFNPMMREVAEMVPQFDRPFVADHRAFTDAFGGTATPHEAALRETIAWVQSTSPHTMQARPTLA